MHIDRALIDTLQLTNIQFEIYKQLLQNNPLTILELSKIFGIPRSTVHYNVVSLIEKGILFESFDRSKRTIGAENPNIFEKILDKKTKIAKDDLINLNNAKSKIKPVINTLQSLIAQPSTKDKTITHYSGKKNVQSIYDDILGSKKIKAYVNSGCIAQIFPDNFDKFIEAGKRGTQIQDLMVDNHEGRVLAEKNDSENYNIRFLPKNTLLSETDYLIFDDNNIAVITVNNYPKAEIIRSKGLQTHSMDTFEIMWGMSVE